MSDEKPPSTDKILAALTQWEQKISAAKDGDIKRIGMFLRYALFVIVDMHTRIQQIEETLERKGLH